MSKQDMSQPSWRFRRRAIFGSLVFSALIILYVAIRWEDKNIGDTLALGAFGLMGAIVASYIGGATYQDVKLYHQMSLNDKQIDHGYQDLSYQYPTYQDPAYQDQPYQNGGDKIPPDMNNEMPTEMPLENQ